MKLKFLSLILLALAVSLFTPVEAQTTVNEKYKVPVLSTILVKYKDSLALPIEEIKNIIDKKLIITDGGKLQYEISSFQVLFTQNAFTEDEQGNTIPTKSLSSARFRQSPLPDIWVKVIREELSKGEEIYFFDIIVKDEKGRIMYAPDLKIIAL